MSVPLIVAGSALGADGAAAASERIVVGKIGVGQPVSNLPDHGGYSGELARLGHIAWWAGGSIEWDGPTMKVTDKPEANQFVGREYRKGWEI